MKRARSQNLSIMLTDMQGYTATSAASSRLEIVELVQRHNRLMEPIIDFYDGTIVKTIGDAFLVTFASATDAVVCGIVIQMILNEYNLNQAEEGKRLFLRVVVNTGDVAMEKNDIFGEGVNIAARLEGLDCFPGGTVGISESTYLLLNRNEIICEPAGSYSLKGIPYPVRVYRVPLEKQNMSVVPVKLIKMAEKLAGTSRGFDDYLGEWNDSVKKYLSGAPAERMAGLRRGLADQTRSTLEEIRGRKESFGSSVREELSRQKGELKEGFSRGVDRLKGAFRRDEE